MQANISVNNTWSHPEQATHTTTFISSMRLVCAFSLSMHLLIYWQINKSPNESFCQAYVVCMSFDKQRVLVTKETKRRKTMVVLIEDKECVL